MRFRRPFPRRVASVPRRRRLQPRLHRPNSPLRCDCDDALVATGRLLSAARPSRAPVVFTTVGYRRSDLDTARAFIVKAPARDLTPGSRWAEIDERIAPAPGEALLPKLFASTVFGTALASMPAARAAIPSCSQERRPPGATEVTFSISDRARVVASADAHLPTRTSGRAAGTRCGSARSSSIGLGRRSEQHGEAIRFRRLGSAHRPERRLLVLA